MADNFQWVDAKGGLQTLTLEQIQSMNYGQFAQYEGRLVGVSRNKRYDTVVLKTDTLYKAGTKFSLFRKGIDDQDNYVNDATTFSKTRIHTNMIKDGEFDQGDLVIIKNISIEAFQFGGKPTAKAAGVITNPKATFPAFVDPSLTLFTLLNQIWMQYVEGNKVVCENKALYYPQSLLMFAAFGANAGAVAMNGAGDPILPNPRVLRGGRDFAVRGELLADLDLTTATGLGQEISMTVALDTVEVTEVVS